MIRVLALCSLVTVALACSRSETTDVATTTTTDPIPAVTEMIDTVTIETETMETGTITPGTTTPAPTATATIAAGRVAGSPSTTPGVPSPAVRPVAQAPATPAAIPQPQTSAAAEPVPAPITDNTPPADAAPAPTANIAGGQPVYKAKCAACHGPDGKKPQGGVTLASDAVQNKSDAELARLIREGKGKVSAAAHKRAALNGEQIRDVVAYIKALK
ncbi:MAG TPA: cytochrome c [Thermoanaerobaculia bacterium]|nr:cytochrome c [Thermoanaerobaculia bacterium]